MAFKDRLKEARLSNGLTQEQVAEKIGVAKSTFTGYEKGNSEPNMHIISQIMKALNVDANYLWQDEMDALGGNPIHLKYNEMEHIKKYRNLDDHGKETVGIILDRETARTNAAKAKEELVEKFRSRISKKETVYHFPEENTTLSMVAESAISYGATSRVMKTYIYLRKIACAGTGFYFDDIPTETMEAPFLEGVDFIIGVSGDSMEPDYFDGDMLYVKKVENLNYGDVGIFTINKECFLKEYGQNGLLSHNNRYNDIPGNEDVRLIGKVIGKVPTD